MRASDELVKFVSAALQAGRSRDDIRAALTEAGWSESETRTALDAWAETAFDIPVPRPRNFVSARELFFHGLIFVALALSAIYLVILGFNLIGMWIEDPSESYRYRYSEDSIRWALANLVVFAPVFLLMNARATRNRRDDPAQRRSSIRKGLAYVAVFVAALTMLGDAIWVIYSALDGDLTLRIIAKSALLLAVAGGIFGFFRKELAELENA